MGLALAWAGVAGCAVHEGAAEDRRATCLYAAVDAYPTWSDPTHRPVLDTIEPCKTLPQADKTAIRRMMADFVSTTEANRA